MSNGNSTTPAHTWHRCDYCHVDLTKAELPVFLVLTLLFDFIALIILFKIRKKSEPINHYLVTTIAANDLVSTVIFTTMWIGGWIKCGCMLNTVTCSIFGWVASASVVWSAWIVIVMSVTRFIATTKPFYYRANITPFKIRVASYSTLIFTLFQLSFPFYGLASPYKYYDDNFICAYDFAPGSSGLGHRVILGFLSAEGLLASLGALYLNGTMIYYMRKKNVISHNDNPTITRSTVSESKIAFSNVCIVISMVFCVCYVPFLVRLLYDVIITNVTDQLEFYHSLTMYLLFLAPLLNPFVYVICNKRYRSYVKTSIRNGISKFCCRSNNRVGVEADMIIVTPNNSKATTGTVTTTIE